MRPLAAVLCVLVGLAAGIVAMWHDWAVALIAIVAVGFLIYGLAGLDLEGPEA